MSTHWKKYLLRHGFYTYARNTLAFFTNLFLWSQTEDLRIVAIFNIVALSVHTVAFGLFLPVVKRGYGQQVMRSGIFGLILLLGASIMLGEDLVNYSTLFAGLIGLFNAMYWLVNHIESLDISDNANRASFLSYRKAVQGGAQLAVPGVGWLVFSLLGNDTAGYSVLFIIGMLAMSFAWWTTDVASRVESKLHFRRSLATFAKTKHMKLKLFNGFLYGISLRSALASVVLPFLIFQIVEKESSLNLIQTGVEVVAIIAVYLFAGHKKNTDYITKLFLIGGGVTLLSLGGLLYELNIATYIFYIVSFVIALSALNIAIGTTSSNYATTIKDYDDNRMEFVVVREPATIAGFILGYVFLYINPDLTIQSLTPLILTMIIATILNTVTNIFLWRYVSEVTGRTGAGA